MPRTRSGLSSSITTRRVCPEETQRCSASSTVAEESTVTTAGIGVITSRASCSCRWKTPVSIVASFASMSPWLPEVWIRERRSSTLWCSSIDSGLTPNRRTIAFEAVDSAQVNGAEMTRKKRSGAASSRATALGAVDRDHLRHLLADRDVERGRDREGEDRSEIAVAAPCSSGPSSAGSISVAIAGSPRKPMPDRGHRDPELAGGEVPVDLLELLEHLLGAARALLRRASRSGRGGCARARTRRRRRRRSGARGRPARRGRARSSGGPQSSGGRADTSREVVVSHRATR